MISTILWAVVSGAVLGILARLILPGRQNISLLLTVLVGMAAAFVGGLVADWIGVGHTSGIDWIKHGIQLALALLGVGLMSTTGRRRA
jgi:uncharacterized membrane protein YeaQ/YmgE (transglycosylase-associated protein family)